MIAERIRALGFPAPGTQAEYQKLASIQETPGKPKAEQMIKLLVQGNEAVVRTARSVFPLVDAVNDEPSADLLTQFDRAMKVVRQDHWSGRHYERTARAWLANLDNRRREVLPILSSVYGSSIARRWLNRWRMFFLAVAELFGFSGGEQWFVAHYLMKPVGC